MTEPSADLGSGFRCATIPLAVVGSNNAALEGAAVSLLTVPVPTRAGGIVEVVYSNARNNGDVSAGSMEEPCKADRGGLGAGGEVEKKCTTVSITYRTWWGIYFVHRFELEVEWVILPEAKRRDGTVAKNEEM